MENFLRIEVWNCSEEWVLIREDFGHFLLVDCRSTALFFFFFFLFLMKYVSEMSVK